MKRSCPLTVDRLEDRCVPSADLLTTPLASTNPNVAIPAVTAAPDTTPPAASVQASSPTVVTLGSPGDQTNLVGDTVNIAVSATNSNGAPVVFSATGLPKGLSIDPNSGTITGTLATSGAQNSVTITATDSAFKGAASVTISWTVKTPALVQPNPEDQASTGGDTAIVSAAKADDGSLLVIDIPIIDPNAVPPSSGQTNPGNNPGNPWAIYGWDSIPLIPPISAPLWY